MLDFGRWRILIALWLSLSPALSHGASTVTPTQEQLQMLKQLPPAQRELLRKAVKDQMAPAKSAEDTLESPDEDVAKPDDADTIGEGIRTADAPPLPRLQAGD